MQDVVYTHTHDARKAQSLNDIKGAAPILLATALATALACFHAQSSAAREDDSHETTQQADHGQCRQQADTRMLDEHKERDVSDGGGDDEGPDCACRTQE
jgi:hypothetical protein